MFLCEAFLCVYIYVSVSVYGCLCENAFVCAGTHFCVSLCMVCTV